MRQLDKKTFKVLLALPVVRLSRRENRGIQQAKGEVFVHSFMTHLLSTY